jgi:quaternary ammonium compound-resistance protein SugE
LSTNLAWAVLVAAGLLEIAWAVGIRYTANWTRLGPSVLVVGAYLVDLYLLSIPMRRIPVGTAYAVWMAIGTVGVTACGIALWGERASLARLGCVALILAGVAGLKLLEA